MAENFGRALELEVKEILEGYGYNVSHNQPVQAYTDHSFKVDVRADNGVDNVVIECKWQEQGGSTCEKLDMDCRKLTKIARHFDAKKTLMIYSGKQMERYLNVNPLAKEMMRDYKNIEFISLGDFSLKLKVQKDWLFA